jgi:hypothetical protein
MHITKLITLICLSSGALSYKIRAFSEPNCKGSARDINVYDNTCRNTDVPRTQSIRVLSYGAARQRANFFDHKNLVCWPGDATRGFWADGGSNDFKLDRCITLGFHAVAYGSASS